MLCLPTPLTLVCGGSPIIPFLIHQPAYLHLASSSITPAGSVQKSRGDQCGAYVGEVEEMVCVGVTEGT